MRRDPLPITTLSAALALAALRAGPPDVSETIAERERLAVRSRELGLAPLPSHANFVYVPTENASRYERLLAQGSSCVRSTTRSASPCTLPAANDRLLDALEQANR